MSHENLITEKKSSSLQDYASIKSAGHAIACSEGAQANPSSNDLIIGAEDTPAYKCLQDHRLLNIQFRKNDFGDIFEPTDLVPKSSHAMNFFKRLRWGVYWTPGCGWMLYKIFHSEVVVPPMHLCRFIDNDNNYLVARPGIHNILSPFLKQIGRPIRVEGHGEVIEHGNRTIVTIPQGMVGYAQDRGQPVLLPPGLHSWISETLKFEKMYNLDRNVVVAGPYTIVTVDEGYAAITQNNGKQEVLRGGETHLLTHQKWRFQKFMTLKIQTNDLEKIEAASADNVIMFVDSTVVWRIKDVHVAATMAAETMNTDNNGVGDISKLRRDVLKQAIASLAGFIGSVNYSDSFHVAAASQRKMETVAAVAVDIQDDNNNTPMVTHKSVENPMFDSQGMSEVVLLANQITNTYGVEICSINIISANPVDDKLTASLATGAVASAEALQAETQARGLGKAMKIEAEAAAISRKINADSHAEATLIGARAEGEADVLIAEGAKAATVLRAEGSKKAAELLETSKIAVTLEMMKTSAGALKHSDKFFFGQEPSYMSNIVMKGPECAALTDEK